MKYELTEDRTSALFAQAGGEHQAGPGRDPDVQDARTLGAIPPGCGCRWVPDPLALPARLTSVPARHCRVHGDRTAGRQR